MTPTVAGRLALESVRRFDGEGVELEPVKIREAIGFVGLERRLQGGWELALGLAGHAWHQPDRGRSTPGVTVRALRVTSSGMPVLQSEVRWTGLYRRAEFDGAGSLRTGRLYLSPRLRLGWGDGLPPQATFPLGGDEGFPGLHIGERRGDREALLGLMATYHLGGPFIARVEFMTARSAAGGPVLGSQGWMTGIRGGMGADTPVGPIRAEYGIANNGRRAVFVRLGRWF